jgi:hypothetical protein
MEGGSSIDQLFREDIRPYACSLRPRPAWRGGFSD